MAEKALRESETRFKAISEQAMDGITVADYDGNYIFVNNSFCKMLGYTQEELLKMKVTDLKPPYTEDLQTFQKTKIIGNATFSNIELCCKDSSIVYTDINACSINLNNEKFILGIVRNVTERKKIEEELIAAKEKAEESDKLKTAFLQNMSHEIRTPLNGIIGFTTLLQDENIKKEEIKEYTSVIQQSGTRLLEIVNNVLDVSKIETGQVTITKKAFLINSLFSKLLTFFAPQAYSKNIKLSCHNLDDTKRIVYSDESKLIQIFTNLINNSLKFTETGRIDFGYKILDTDIQFYVSDTGTGISNEYFNNIFDRFTQVDLKITRGYEGAGLGLAICKGLVELLGGDIWLESEVGKGSTFFFTIPLIEAETELESDSIGITKELNLSLCKILIAEDDWTSYQYISKLLANTEITILHADNGEKAVEYVSTIPDINLVLMDIKMPIMNGIEATKLIKQLRPELPIIAQTAYAFSSEREEILSVGCTDYISKPISKGDLLKLIEQYQ
jgi:PAS domain S-box-containing protein